MARSSTTMCISDRYKGKTGAEVWETLVGYVLEHGAFTSITGIRYSATFVGSCIFVKGGSPGTKRADKGEYLTGKDFVAAYDVVRTFDSFNTCTIKPYIRRQQTLFVGLLTSAGVIEIMKRESDLFKDIQI